MLNKKLRFKCAKCKGPKFIGEEFYFAGEKYVDLTCAACADSKDIKVSDLEAFVNKVMRGHRGK